MREIDKRDIFAAAYLETSGSASTTLSEKTCFFYSFPVAILFWSANEGDLRVSWVTLVLHLPTKTDSTK